MAEIEADNGNGQAGRQDQQTAFEGDVHGWLRRRPGGRP